jgi:hypothetical protein
VFIVFLGVSIAVHTSTASPIAQKPFYKVAQLMCNEQRSPQAGFMSGPSTIAGELPNVGSPMEIIVAPSCYQYSTSSKKVYFIKEVTVYLVVSPEQLTKLSSSVSDTLPMGVQDRALNHLVTKQQRFAIEYGSEPNTVEYVLATSSMSAARVRPGVTLSRFQQQTLPRDILTGTYYVREPKPSVREAYTTGPLIEILGTK